MVISNNSIDCLAKDFYNKKKQKAGGVMITSLRYFESRSFDPYYNLAVEKCLLDTIGPEACVLYLWQNQNTVVIGRSQNPWAECRTTLLSEEGGVLARRLSGGGAVFHDLGNLNFTFLVGTENYDVDRQLSVIQEACRLAGITAEKSGRNDLLADGRKFSGNAFYHSAGHSYHHGTLMIDVDKDKLQRYLSPPKAKLLAKGISSVRSRVVNLKELSPSLTIDTMKTYMVQAFQTVYGYTAAEAVLTDTDLAIIQETEQINKSWDFLFGKPLPFTFQCEDKFDWGYIQLQLQAKGGVITAAKVYSDSMDWELAPAVETALTGCRFRLEDMEQALTSALDGSVACDLCQMLKNQDI